MKVSIITATYNSSKVIQSCMSSVLNQTYNKVEYIIIDGASKDATLDIVKAISNDDTRVHVFSEPDQGIYDALNKGIQKASGDIIGFVHSDDLLTTNTVISEIVSLVENNAIDGVYGNLNYVSKEDTSKIIRKWESQPFNSKLLKRGWMPPHPTVFLKKSIYDKHGLFNLKYKIAADYDFMVRVFSDISLKFEYLDKVITNMRVGGASNRSLNNIIQKSREDHDVIKRHNIGGVYTLFMKNFSKIRQFF